ncbi:MAG: hypothetical protein R2757_10105 [Draconibacterium sp.]
MAFAIKYRELFKVSIHHLFFLNKGEDEFNSMNDSNKSKQLESFNVNEVFKIIPIAETARKLNGHHLVFKAQRDGFSVWAKVTGIGNDEPFVSLADELSFTFVLKLIDPGFYNYTDLKMENARKTYYFSNKRLNTESGSFPLINSSGDNQNIDETFVLSDDGELNEKEKLTPAEKNNLFGIISLFVKGDDIALNLTTTQGKLFVKKEFEIQLNNRKTFWRYIFNSNQSVNGSDDVKVEDADSKVLVTKTDHPLTDKGFIALELGGAELPNPDKGLSIFNAADNNYYSEIYM